MHAEVEQHFPADVAGMCARRIGAQVLGAGRRRPSGDAALTRAIVGIIGTVATIQIAGSQAVDHLLQVHVGSADHHLAVGRLRRRG